MNRDNVVFLRITNPVTKKVTGRGFEIKPDGIILNPANQQPCFFEGCEKEPVRVTDSAVEIVNDSNQFAVEQFLTGECKSIASGVKAFHAKKEDAKKAERKAENDFLKSKGYRWEKRSLYNSGDGEMQSRWLLFDPDGEIAVGYKDGGFDLIPFGSVKEILIELGYYGQSAIDEKQQADEARANRKAMRHAIESYFENTESEMPESFESDAPVLRIESHMPRRQFRILDGALVLEVHNTSDGDNWSINNCDYGVASVFPYQAEIADYLRQLATKPSDQPTSITE